MADNLLDMLKSQVGSAAMGQLSQHLGVGQDKAGSIIEKAGAAMLGGMMQKASTPTGLGDLFNMVQKAGGSGIPDLGAILGSPQKRDEYVRGGEEMTGKILGNNLPALIAALGPILGIAKNFVGPLMGMIGPMLMGMISKQMMGKAMNPQGLTDLLMSQKEHVQAALPASLAPALGLTSFGDLGKAAGQAADVARSAANYGADAARAAANTGKAAVEEGTSLINTLLPLIGLALLALLGLFALRSCAPPEEPIEPAVRTDADRDTIIPGDPAEKAVINPASPSPLPGPGAESRVKEAVERGVDATGDALKKVGEEAGTAIEGAAGDIRDAAGATGRAIDNAAEDAAKAVDRAR